MDVKVSIILHYMIVRGCKRIPM